MISTRDITSVRKRQWLASQTWKDSGPLSGLRPGGVFGAAGACDVLAEWRMPRGKGVQGHGWWGSRPEVGEEAGVRRGAHQA